MNPTIELLKARRSAPLTALCGPGPSTHEIDALLQIAARVPDHGKLAPWRFIVFEGEGRGRERSSPRSTPACTPTPTPCASRPNE
jgi:nitroreductase